MKNTQNFIMDKDSLWLGRLKRWKMFKILSCFVAFVFLFEQIAFSADRIGYRRNYSCAKTILSKKTDLDQTNRMSPQYLQNAQRKHELVIQSKNMIEENLVYLIDKRSRGEVSEENLPLKRRTSPDQPAKQIKYTLSDFDNTGQAQQISVYSYRDNSRSLEKVVSYDIRDIDTAIWTKGDLEEISEEGEEKVLGSFVDRE
ncbi:MAG: hypothetical protein ISS33_04215, partial [Candidatus Omnitrophica bacterium]|nr:hypothetical protein [Candidatus Omnitrophota bacterium]